MSNSMMMTPIVIAEPAGETARLYRDLAGRLAAQVSIRSFESPSLHVIEE